MILMLKYFGNPSITHVVIGGHLQMASKISESFFSALHSSSKFPSRGWLRNTRRIFIPVVLWHLYVKSRQELENGVVL